MKIRFLILLIVLSWGLFGCTGDDPAVVEETLAPTIMPQEEETTMTFGVFPYISPTRLEAAWVPIVVAFNQSSPVSLQLRTSNSFDEFNARLNSTGYDVALIQPFDYVQLTPDTFEPLVKFDEPLTGIFVVRQDSDIHHLSDLAGKTVSTPPETAAVTILAQITLEALGVENVTYTHQNSHDQCLQLLLIGQADACITNIVPLRTFEETLNQTFTVLGDSLEIPHVLVATQAGLSTEKRDSLKNFLIELSTYDEGRQLLSNVGVHGFVDATDSDYDIVRRYWAEYKQ